MAVDVQGGEAGGLRVQKSFVPGEATVFSLVSSSSSLLTSEDVDDDADTVVEENSDDDRLVVEETEGINTAMEDATTDTAAE